MGCGWRWVEKWEMLMTTIMNCAVIYSFVHSNTHTLYCAMHSIWMWDDYAVGVLFSLLCCCICFGVYGIVPLYSLCLVSVVGRKWILLACSTWLFSLFLRGVYCHLKPVFHCLCWLVIDNHSSISADRECGISIDRNRWIRKNCVFSRVPGRS